MKKTSLILCTLIVSTFFIFTGCSKESNITSNSDSFDIEAAPSDDSDALLDSFLNNEIPAYFEKEADSIMLSDLPMNEADFASYTVGDRVDLDNDGSNELILDGLYGGMYLDPRNGKVYVMAIGEGTTGVLSYCVYDGATWVVHSDLTHAGRQFYWFSKYDGEGNIVDEFQLSAEYWDSPEDTYDENSTFLFRDQSITMEEYENLVLEIFGTL